MVAVCDECGTARDVSNQRMARLRLKQPRQSHGCSAPVTAARCPEARVIASPTERQAADRRDGRLAFLLRDA
jgi:hypothetical protein